MTLLDWARREGLSLMKGDGMLADADRVRRFEQAFQLFPQITPRASDIRRNELGTGSMTSSQGRGGGYIVMQRIADGELMLVKVSYLLDELEEEVDLAYLGDRDPVDNVWSRCKVKALYTSRRDQKAHSPYTSQI